MTGKTVKKVLVAGIAALLIGVVVGYCLETLL